MDAAAEKLRAWLLNLGATPTGLGTSWPLSRGEVLGLLDALKAKSDEVDDLRGRAAALAHLPEAP